MAYHDRVIIIIRESSASMCIDLALVTNVACVTDPYRPLFLLTSDDVKSDFEANLLSFTEEKII